MANEGLSLAAGLAQGINQGVDSYTKTKQNLLMQALMQRQADREDQSLGLRQKQYTADLYEKGLLENPSGGGDVTSQPITVGQPVQQSTSGLLQAPKLMGVQAGTDDGGMSSVPSQPVQQAPAQVAPQRQMPFSYTPEKQAVIDRQHEMVDPNSPTSQRAQKIAQGLLKGAGVKAVDTSGMSAQDLMSENGLIGKAISGAYSAQGRQITSQRMGDRTDVMRENLEERRNQNSKAAGEEFEKDSIIKQGKTHIGSLGRSQNILNNDKVPLTAAQFNLAYTDFINSTAAANSATEGKISRELPESFAKDWGNLKNKFGQYDDLRKDPRMQPLIGILNDNINAMKNDWKSMVAGQASNIAESYSANTNPKVKKVVQDKLKAYGGGNTGAGSGLMGGDSQMSGEDQQALQWAKSNPQDPRAAAIMKKLGQ